MGPSYGTCSYVIPPLCSVSPQDDHYKKLFKTEVDKQEHSAKKQAVDGADSKQKQREKPAKKGIGGLVCVVSRSNTHS